MTTGDVSKPPPRRPLSRCRAQAGAASTQRPRVELSANCGRDSFGRCRSAAFDAYSRHVTDWYAEEELPKFGQPPVIETVLALEFVPLARLTAIKLVQLQDSWIGSYSMLSEQPALPPNRPAQAQPSFEVLQGAPRMRIWAEAADGSGYLLQSQHDRLVLNWRRPAGATGAAYPGYEQSKARFVEALAALTAFRDHHDLGAILPIAVEFGYVNTIDISEESPLESAIAMLTKPDVEVPGTARLTRFQTVRGVDKSESDPFSAQITIAAEPLSVDSRDVSMSVTTRVLLETEEQASVLRAADAAHALSSHTFARVTNSGPHEVWEREQ